MDDLSKYSKTVLDLMYLVGETLSDYRIELDKLRTDFDFHKSVCHTKLHEFDYKLNLLKNDEYIE